MPDGAKLTRQGQNRHLIAAAERAGIGDGYWSHDAPYAELGCPPRYTLEGVPRYRWELRDRHGAPTQLLADALLRGIQPQDNPDYLATIRTMGPSAKASAYAESFSCGRDSVGVATMVWVGNRRVIAALGSMGNCVPADHPDHYPLAPKVRSVTPTGGRIEGALPYGYRWATDADQPGHNNTGYTVKLETDTPEPPAPKRERGKRSPEGNRNREARKLAKRRRNRSANN